MKTIETTRFGNLTVEDKDIITFEEGPLGFETLKKFFIIDPGDQTLILWLQSLENPETAFPILEPRVFLPESNIKLLPAEMNSLKLESLADASVYTILTIPAEVTDMSANLKAPIVINNKLKLARQIVLQDSKLEVRFKMYKELKTYLVNFSSDDSKRTEATGPKAFNVDELPKNNTNNSEEGNSKAPLRDNAPFQET